MIDKRLLAAVPGSKKYIALNVLIKWISLAANIAVMSCVAWFISALFEKSADLGNLLITVGAAALSLAVRCVCAVQSQKMSFLSSREVKKTLREKIYTKLLRLGAAYSESVSTSEVVQVSTEGVDQLETYFGSYLPQFFYAMLAPVTLFTYMCFINVPAAVVLLVCVPLIPVSIALVQTWAKKLFSKYWGQYTALGDIFLENLQGLTTLKIYRADEAKTKEMNEEAEKFRKITMRVLVMQLNSITIMDFIAYGGAALGIIMAALGLKAGSATLCGALIIILLSADFFIPMRQLGSFFHVAMNGMAASGKIFKLLDLPEPEEKSAGVKDGDIKCENLSFSYEPEREILRAVSMVFPSGSFTSIVGESGCGKSTLAAVLTGKLKGYSGSVKAGGLELSELSEKSLMKHITYVSHQSYIFKGTVRDNLLMAKPDAADSELWAALEAVRLSGFLRETGGPDTVLSEAGSNLSGGQRQRLALARALLHDSPVYIFDEATSNIDAESENDIMEQIHALAGKKTVILIAHRLANVTNSDNIYVMDGGMVAESGKHEDLLKSGGLYKKMWDTQQSLENFTKGAA